MRIQVSDSYSIELPNDVVEDIDGRVWSYWISGEETLLQFSSYIQYGEQTSAGTRIEERMARDGVSSAVPMCIDSSAPDQAAIMFIDDKGIRWVYAYLVWPDLCIFVTASMRSEEVDWRDSWSLQALKTIERTTNTTP